MRQAIHGREPTRGPAKASEAAKAGCPPHRAATKLASRARSPAQRDSPDAHARPTRCALAHPILAPCRKGRGRWGSQRPFAAGRSSRVSRAAWVARYLLRSALKGILNHSDPHRLQPRRSPDLRRGPGAGGPAYQVSRPVSRGHGFPQADSRIHSFATSLR